MSESFEKLQNRILSDARMKADEIIREAEEKSRQLVENSRAQARREAEAFLTKAKLDAEALRRSILSSKIRANRLRLLEEKNRIVRSILSTVEERLSSLGQTQVFMDSLKKMVNEAVEAVGSDQPTVRIGFDGVGAKALGSAGQGLPGGAKLVVEEKPIDELGGVIASDPEGRLIYNNSFRARLDRLDSQLLALISSTVLSE